jgi:hypothetical protein
MRRSHAWVAMQIETKFLRLFREATIGDRIDGWRVCWIGGWDKCRVLFVLMVERQTTAPLSLSSLRRHASKRRAVNALVRISAGAISDGRPYRATILLVSCECLGTAIRAVQQIQQKPANASYRRTLIRSEFLPLLVQ